MNGVEIGRSYALPTSHLTDIVVTLMAGGIIAVRDEFNELFILHRENLEDLAETGDHTIRPIAWEILRQLLTGRHDECDWPWTRAKSNPRLWIRVGQCSTCGQW